MYMSPIIRYSLGSLVFIATTLLGFQMPAPASADTSAGWYSFRSEYLGSTSGCPSNHTRMDIAFKEYGSFADINPQGVRIKL